MQTGQECRKNSEMWLQSGDIYIHIYTHTYGGGEERVVLLFGRQRGNTVG